MASTQIEVEIKVTDLASEVIEIAIKVAKEAVFMSKHIIIFQNLSR